MNTTITRYLQPRDVLDSCIAGISQRPGDAVPVVLYDRCRCVEAVAKWQRVSHQDAARWLDVAAAAGGHGAPEFVHLADADEVNVILAQWNRETFMESAS